ncbi:MAG: hypothetical protein JRF53_08535 [Deltaproteobacteria bacterium]|nr:hypothetical protein [Deltaproteobacteria bacterium]
MTRDQLEHAIRAACDVSKDTEKMIDVKILTERISSLNVKEQRRERLLQWVKITAEELDRQMSILGVLQSNDSGFDI